MEATRCLRSPACLPCLPLFHAANVPEVLTVAASNIPTKANGTKAGAAMAGRGGHHRCLGVTHQQPANLRMLLRLIAW